MGVHQGPRQVGDKKTWGNANNSSKLKVLLRLAQGTSGPCCVLAGVRLKALQASPASAFGAPCSVVREAGRKQSTGLLCLQG